MMLSADYDNLFDAMEEYREEHPGATDEECFDAVRRIRIDKFAALYDYAKDQRREQHF